MADAERSLAAVSEFRGRAVAGEPRPDATGARDAQPVAELPRGTVTFLLTDIEGSTRAWEAHGLQMAAAVARHYEILDAAVLGNGGVRPIEQGEGDSLVAAFERPSDAVAAALAAQRGLTAEEWPVDVPLVVRMAVHTGEAQIRDERYYAGPSIIRCARLRALGHGAQVLISGTTADLLADGLPDAASLFPLGVHRVRDLRQPLRVFQLSHPALRADFPPLKSIDALPNNLPVQLTSFVGRRADIDELTGLVREHRLVCLVGPGGAGKTRLAAQLAAELVEQFPDGVWWIDLTAVTSGADVPLAVMTGLGIGDNRGMDPLDRAADYVGGGRVLLVVDNCEQVLPGAAAALERLLRACPGLAALATSREPLDLPGEVAWRVAPLPFPVPDPDGMVSVEATVAAESVQLFLERVFDARPTFRVDSSNAATVAAICTQLDGLPLALELAAARTRTLSPERILTGLSERFRLLTGGARTAPARQQTLQASVEWSHDLLAEAERVLLRRLAVFTGGFGLDAAEAVATGPYGGGCELTDWDVLGLLSELVDKSLVVFDGERYGMLVTLHAFARARLADSGEEDALRERHAAYFLARAEEAADALRAEVRPAPYYALRPDHANIRAGLEWAHRNDRDDLAHRYVIALMYHWATTGRFTEGLAWHRRALAKMPDAVDPVRCQILWGLGNLSLQCVELANGLGVSELSAALQMAQELDDPVLLARPMSSFGAIQVLATADDPLPMLQQATALSRSVGDVWAVTYARWWEAAYWVFVRNQPERAEPALVELDDLGTRGDHVSCLGWNNAARAIGHHMLGRHAEAWAESQLCTARSFACDEALLGVGALLVGGSLLELGKYEQAEAVWSRALQRCRREGDASRQNMVEIHLARLPLALGDVATGAARAAAMEPAVRASMIPLFVHYILLLRCRAEFEQGNRKTSRACLAEALAGAEHMNYPHIRAEAYYLDSLLLRDAGDAAAAEDRLHQALALQVEYGLRGWAANTCEALGKLAVAGVSFAEGARVFGAAHALRHATGHKRWPLDQPAYDTAVTAARAALGEEAFERCWAEGLALSLPEAAAYASRARGERKRPSSGWESLTPTELQVVALAATGANNAEIATKLFIAPTTAKTHLQRIYAKLDIPNRAVLAAEATARGITAGR